MYFILYSQFKNIGYVWNGEQKISDFKKKPASGPRPPVLKYLDPPPDAMKSILTNKLCLQIL